MNRIYQGRVTKVELLDDRKDEVLREFEKGEGEALLWQHHGLFQDAVNYYLVCLMALAHDEQGLVTRIKRRANGEKKEDNVWAPFVRNGQQRQGMREVARYFGLSPETASLDDCCRKALEGNKVPADLLDLALKELLHFCSGDGQIQQEGRSMLPRFCNPASKTNFNTGETADLRAAGEARLRSDLHELKTQKDLERFADELQIGWVVNVRKGGQSAKGEQARERLLKSIAHFGQYNSTHKATTKPNNRTAAFMRQRADYRGLIDTLEKKIKGLEAEKLPEIPANAKSIPDRLEACLLFKYFPSVELAELLKFLFPPKPSKEKKEITDVESPDFAAFGDDAIKLARGSRGYVFPAFTGLPIFSGAEFPKIQWVEFDHAAFKEALKALNQVKVKGEERENRRARLQAKLDYMLGKAKKFDPGEDEADEPQVVAGDPRVERLEKVLEGMKQAYDMTDDELADYGLHERTIRGFVELRKDWNKVRVDRLGEGDAVEELKKVLAKLQADNKETIGSASLFGEFIKPDNWIIWKHPDDETAAKWEAAKFGSNPLAGLVQRRELEEEIERLEEPIRFTPADPRHSRRQFPFGDRNTFKNRKGAYRHEANALQVIVGLAIKEDGIWRERRVRLMYSAPRFLRDGLRGADEDMMRMPWLQPMMEALGVRTELPQDMHSYAVFLMPSEQRDGGKVIHLNFPVTLDESPLVGRLGKAARWDRQFAGAEDKRIYLRWPEDEWPKGWKETRWYEEPAPFRLLSVDLGQRDAGAYALLSCRPDENFGSTQDGKPRRCRFIGQAWGRKWQAAVERTGLLRLPGEDAQVLKNGKWMQELSGEKGRLAKPEESEQAVAIAKKLGFEKRVTDEPFSKYFVVQNQKLLTFLRWAQSRLARLRGWSWMLQDAKRKEAIRAELAQSDEAPQAIRELAGAGKWELVLIRLAEAIEESKGAIGESLVSIANRVLPLKGRRWEWQARQDGKGFVLLQGARGSDSKPTWIAGHRGLSMERLGQVEDLRKRCQSFNRVLLSKTGERARMGHAAKGLELPDPCPEILEKLDRLREQRVNQTAHLILAEALGVRLKAHGKSSAERLAKDIHGEYEKVREPVDFIVLEDLSRYLSSQGRSRGENSRLMKWCHRAVLGKLKQICEVYGLPVLEVGAAYSSRFSAKDGTPGFRAVEVGLKDRNKYPWKKALTPDGKGDKDILALFARLEQIGPGDDRHPRTLLAPMAVGPLFVPMQGPVEQADINASINLGLRAVAAPGCLDIHQRIRTEKGKDGVLIPLTKSKREKARWGKKPPSFKMDQGEICDRNSNFFPLIQFDVDYERATLEGMAYAFGSGKALWGKIKDWQWKRVREINEARILRNGWAAPLNEPLPM